MGKYLTIPEIDRRVHFLNMEVTHINKIKKHYASYKECLNEEPNMTFEAYLSASKESLIEERSALLEKRKKLLEAVNYKEVKP